MLRVPTLILEAGNRLFWDVDAASLDPGRHEDFIVGRVLSDGDEAMVRALRAEIGDEGLRDFLLRAPHRLDERTRRFLEVVLDVDARDEERCTTTLFRRSSGELFNR